MVELAHARGVMVIDDLGAGALLDLRPFGLPHEPTVQESVAAGADVVLFSADKLIGAGRAASSSGAKTLIDTHPQAPALRALRVDKTCLMALERTLHLFRDPEQLPGEHPLYRMLATPPDALRAARRGLARPSTRELPRPKLQSPRGVAYLGSGSLPMEAMPSLVVTVCCRHEGR